MNIEKKPLSGSDSGKKISLSTEMKQIHKTPDNVEYSELWLYAENKTKRQQDFVLCVNEVVVIITLHPEELQDIYGSYGAKIMPGDDIKACCETEDAVFITGFVYEIRKE